MKYLRRFVLNLIRQRVEFIHPETRIITKGRLVQYVYIRATTKQPNNDPKSKPATVVSWVLNSLVEHKERGGVLVHTLVPSSETQLK